MKFGFTIHALPAVVACSLLSCSNSSSPGEKAWSDFNSNFYNGLESTDSLAGAKIPILRSPAYEARWGSPKISVSPVGNYELSYANPDQPFDRLVIYGSVAPYPELTKAPEVSSEIMVNDELTGVTNPQNFRTVSIQGQPVKWFQETTSGGADGAYYSTEGFALKDVFGNTGYYRMVVEAGNGADAEVHRRFSSGDFR